MTEEQWISESHPGPLLAFLQRKISERKLLLYLVACCRHLWHFFSDDRSRNAVDLAERLADGWAFIDEVSTTFAEAKKAAGSNAFALAARPPLLPTPRQTPQETAAFIACVLLQRDLHPIPILYCLAYAAQEAVWHPEAAREGIDWNEIWDSQAEINVQVAENAFQVNLLRHIIGNPFHPSSLTLSWSSQIVDLANALYLKSDCAFALHDALLEAGHAELAEHFREPVHPKGCWALDLILGKN
jgi:hypothetical protein